MPAGTLSAIGSTLSFGLGTAPSRDAPPPREASPLPPHRTMAATDAEDRDRRRGGRGASRDEYDDEIPDLPHTGSLPPRKRTVVLAPDSPDRWRRPPDGREEEAREPRGEGRRGGGRGIRDARDGGGGGDHRGRYEPHTVHDPREGRRSLRDPAATHHHNRHHPAPPSVWSSHSYDRHDNHHRHHRHHHLRSYGSYDRADDRGQSAGPYGRDHRLRERRGEEERFERLRRAASWDRRDRGDLPDRHRSLAPRRHRHPGDVPEEEGGTGAAAGSSHSDSSLCSRRSFRSLEDLDDPDQMSLLYRPSFSWERGLAEVQAPQSSSGGVGAGGQPHAVDHHGGQGGGHGHGHGHGGHYPGEHGGYHHHPGYGPPPHHHHHYHQGPPPPPPIPLHHPRPIPIGPPSHGHGWPGSAGSAIPPPPDADDGRLVELHQQQKALKALTMRGELRTIGDPSSSSRGGPSLILLLAMPQDRHCLSETLCIIRNNVEVFTADDEDVHAPAPGRKRPVRVGQVGLRCVYCRMIRPKDRIKRATCFPSSVKRIYRAAIDMKLDHFKACPHVPPGLKARLDHLQAGSTRSTGMTVQYFVKSAKEMGLVDMEEGVCIDLRRVGAGGDEAAAEKPAVVPARKRAGTYARDGEAGSGPVHTPPRKETSRSQKGEGRQTAPRVQDAPPAASADVDRDDNDGPRPPPGLAPKQYFGRSLLSLPDDKNFLSPLRCFLRRTVCAFTATARDIAVRTPTTVSVSVGQVGVGCIYCLAVPPKQRSNRAVCFPFTVARIYQSVADIQRFHLGECRMMPPEVRAQFVRLQAESAKGSRGLATRQYWIDAGRRLGLADGPQGIYFCRDPGLPAAPPGDRDGEGGTSDALSGACGMDRSPVGNIPLVTPEDRPTIADFLYLVMEQLRPCRFTAADKNKRRSKDVGSIGVECRHCAGTIDGRKFFWSSVSAAESNFVSVHSHMMACKYLPQSMKDELARLKALRREQTSKLKTGSQKAFFTRVWARLHGDPIPHMQVGSMASNGTKGGKSSAQLEVIRHSAIGSSPPKEKGRMGHGHTNSDDGPLNDLDLGKSHDSDELRALLESKSTLSSMPSVDESMLIRHGTFTEELDHVQEVDDEDGAGTGSSSLGTMDLARSPDGRLRSGYSGESGENINSLPNKGSLTSVARELSAVSVRSNSKEEHTDASG
ncbi:hypothetical protein ACHAWF_017959 [Thalassiosira exigua]